MQSSFTFRDCKPTSEYFKKEIDRIFDYRFRGPMISNDEFKKKQTFTLNAYEKKKIDYIISLGQYDNSFEKLKPYFDLFYRYNFSESRFRKWKIRLIQFENKKLILDIDQAQYLTKTYRLNQKSELFLFPLVIGSAKQEQKQQQMDVLLSELMTEGRTTYKKTYPLKEKHESLYLLFSLLFLGKFLYRYVQMDYV